MSLYEKYGGFPTINQIVLDFYQRIGEEESLASYFDGVNMQKLVEHQTAFIAKVLEGPDQYTGRSLAIAHRRLNIKSEDFDLVGNLLKSTLEDAGVEAQDVEAVMNIVGSVKSEIVSAQVSAS